MPDHEAPLVMYPCERGCGHTWSSRLVAAECCDPAYDDLIDRGRE